MNRDLAMMLILSVLAIVLLALIATSLPFSQPLSEKSPIASTNMSEQPDQNPRLRINLPFSSELIQFAFLGVLSVILATAVFAVYRLRRGPLSKYRGQLEVGDTGQTPENSSLEDIAETAGRTAERIRHGSSRDLKNEVYQAWQEMTQELTVTNRQSKTPREFAILAIQVGMTERDVRELTSLFEDVRYGDMELTSEDEQHAIDLLKRIQHTYGADQS